MTDDPMNGTTSPPSSKNNNNDPSSSPHKVSTKCIIPSSSLQSTTSWQGRRRRPKKLRLITGEDKGTGTGAVTSKATSSLSTSSDNHSITTVHPHVHEIKVKDAFEFNHDQFYNEICFGINNRERPLPSISTLLSVAPQQREGHGSCSSSKRHMIVHSKDHQPSVSSIPLLRDFFTSLEKVTKRHDQDTDSAAMMDEKVKLSQDEIMKGHTDENNSINNENQNPLDQTSTILTQGHHKRFKELLIEIEKDGFHPNDRLRKRKAFGSKRARQKEFRKLCDLFREERCRYAIAIENFHAKFANQFLTGFRSKYPFGFACVFCLSFKYEMCIHHSSLFTLHITYRLTFPFHVTKFQVSSPASNFVNVHSEYAKRWKQCWINAQKQNLVSNTYGPCTQAISLLGSAEQMLVDSVGPNMFEPTIVYRDIDSLPMLKSGWIESLEGKRLTPCIISAPESKLLCEDELAKSLAFEHHADIVLTSESLETFLKNPEYPSGRWTIPLCFVNIGFHQSSENLIPFLENPLPCVANPRECLSVGVNESLIGNALDMKDHHSQIKGKYAYTMITIPTSNKKLRALIRSKNYLIDEHQKPVVLLSQLEYFLSKCGVEKFTDYDRALWLLTKMLQADSRLLVIRVDASAVKVVKSEEKTVADALTTDESTLSERFLESLGPFEESDSTNIASLLQIICTILSATQLIEKRTDRQYLLCRESATNVICRSNVKDQSNSALLLDVVKEVDDKGIVVLLNESSLLSCFKSFQWKSETQFPFTFSFKDTAEEIDE